ncbi:Thioesterase/thiol ester dehydrase-isomerase [Nemania sp. FL0916]|nr:Thioesterase/thiol ester dehydrase-isomerase [Nemania sp. FL0916]
MASKLPEHDEIFKAYTEHFKGDHDRDWSASIISAISLISCSAAPPHPRAVIRLTVQPAHANAFGNLHGGCAATIFDVCTTFVLHVISRPGFWQVGGVSRTLNVTYLRPVPVGTTVDIECEVVNAGQRLSALRAVMRTVEEEEDGKEGVVLAICEHGKYNTDPPLKKL